MTDREYVFRKADGNWSKPTGLAKHMAVARDRVDSRHSPFYVTQDGDRITRKVQRATALDRYQTAIENRELGATFRIRQDDGGVAFVGRACKDQPDAIDINGNHHADEMWGWIVHTYPQFHPRFGGSYVCKYVAGSSERSQHSFGNALDVFFGTLAQQMAVFHDIEQHQCPVPVAHAISGNRIWEPGVGEHGYTGEYHSHLHTDYIPQYSGACGVRG